MQNSDTTRPTATNRWDLFLARYHLSSPPFLVTGLHFLTFPLPKLCGVGQCLSFTLLLHVFSVKLYFATSQPVSTNQSHLQEQPLEGLRISSALPPFSSLPSLGKFSEKGSTTLQRNKRIHLASGEKKIIILFFFLLLLRLELRASLGQAVCNVTDLRNSIFPTALFIILISVC